MPAKGRPAKGRLSISRLSVRGVLGIEESTIDLGTVTVLEGRNGSGKSSHLKALRSALGIDRTSLARLARVRDGAEPGANDDVEPTVEVLLVGEDREVAVTRKGDASSEVRERIGDDWRKVPRPAEWLRDLIDVQAANPAAWLAANDEQRAAMLLEAMPLDGYSRVAALAAAGLQAFHLSPIPAGLHPLEELEAIEAQVFSSRTEVNRQERAEHDAAQKLLAGLPAEPPADLSARVAELEAATQALAAELSRGESEADAAERAATKAAADSVESAKVKVQARFREEAGRLRQAHANKAAEIRAAAERRIAELAAETESAIDALRTRGETELDQAEAAAEVAGAAARESWAAARQRLAEGRGRLAEQREELAELRARQQTAETDRTVRATAKAAEDKARQWGAKAAQLTAAIDALRRYRLELAEQLPIKGLAVKFDDKGRKSLTLDGVPLAQVNDGRLVELATEVSLLRNRPVEDGRPYLPIVLLDGIERLDPGRRAALLREIASRGAQVIAACVGPDAMRSLRGEDVEAVA